MTESVGLYLHYPFCRKKCGYCDFYSLPALSLRRDYEKALCRALESAAEMLRDRCLATVYFGGGTPSLLTEEGGKEIFSRVFSLFRVEKDAEITLEANPESTTEKALSSFLEWGVNRLSFGMQSFLPHELALLGRIHTRESGIGAFQNARRAGFNNISLDLMYGLPGQKKEEWEESVSTALSLSPEHLSFYALTLSPDCPLAKRAGALPDEDESLAFYLSAIEKLQKAGLEQYEISNAAKPGFASRHNLNYWQGGEYLGLGPGAHSFFGGERFAVAADLHRFLQAEDFHEAVTERTLLSEEDRAEEYIMLSLRLAKGLDLDRLEELAGREKRLEVARNFSLWEKGGLCRKTEKGYALTPRGFFVSNEIISRLI